MHSFSEIVEKIKELKGLKHDYEVAELLNIKQNTISTNKNRNSISIKKITAFCHKEGISLDWLLYNKGEMLPDKQNYKCVFETIPNDPDSLVTSNEFVEIPRFSDKISAGGGLIPINDVEIKVAFRRDWIRRKGDPEKMSLISVSGDSMYPTLMAGDLVLINHNQNHLDPQGGLYAIALGDIILIKRLQILYPSGKVRITSDNEKYDSFDLAQEEVKINGRVIWFGREL